MSDIVKKYDYDRYLATLFCLNGENIAKKDDIFAFWEFNTELALIKTKISDPTMGMVRLKWWEEQIDKIYEGGEIEDNNYATTRLKEIVIKYQIDKEDISSITLNRCSDLSNLPFESKDEFYAYVYNTSFIPMKIISKICKSDEIISKNSDIFAFLAKKWAISAIFRSSIRNISRNRMVFPIDLIKKYELSADKIKQPNFKLAFKNIAKDLMSDLNGEYEVLKNKFSKDEIKKFAESNPHFFVLNKIGEIYLKKFIDNDFENLLAQKNLPLNIFDMIKLSVGYRKF